MACPTLQPGANRGMMGYVTMPEGRFRRWLGAATI